ncbi:MAG: pentapeptide repeat-containing protein [Tumebacillaceae bacterium]
MPENHEVRTPTHDNNRLRLQADCEKCFGLCCVALPFAASSDFAVDKAAGQPCSNMQADFRCGVHTNLRELGFRGCTVYDCFGAGQHVAQVTYGGNDWRQHPGSAKQMSDVFPIMRQLHELLWYLTEALSLPVTRSIHSALRDALDNTERLTNLSPDELLKLDVAAHRAEVNVLLLQTSELVRAEARQRQTSPAGRKKTRGRGENVENLRGADLIGKNFKGADLRGANLRGSYLIAADLRGADLRMADLIGVDFRDADLRGADLTDSLFLTQFQVNAARGDAGTKLPPSLTHPPHWSSVRSGE